MRGERGNPIPYRDHLVFHMTMTMRPSTAPGRIMSNPLTLWREGPGKYQDSHPFYGYRRTQMKLVKVGAKVVRQGRYVTFEPAEVAVPRGLFEIIARLIADLRRKPAPA